MSDDLAKMGAARVRRSLLNGIKCIEKQPVSVVEFQFYQQVAPVFRAAGIAVPLLLSSNHATQTLLLEYIPYSMEQPEIAASTQVLAAIARIHQHPVNPAWSFTRLQWLPETTERALALLNLPEQYAVIIRDVEKSSASLFRPHSLISGDTNAGNWGKRERGEVVLFDWERFSTGSPAIDLAPLIKGMGGFSDFTDLAKRYQDAVPGLYFPELAQEIAICKLWIVTEVIDILYRNRKAELNLYLAWYRENLPGWLQALKSWITP